MNVLVIASDIVGLGAIGLVASRVAGLQLPWVTTDRAALIGITVLGFGMCSLAGAARSIGPLGFAHPLTIIGTVLGIAAVAVVALALTGSAIINDRTAFFAVAGIIAVKWAIDLAYGIAIGFPKAALGS